MGLSAEPGLGGDPCTTLSLPERKARADAVPHHPHHMQTVCTYWLRGLCMKGESCGFLHQFDPARMPICRNLLKTGVCKDVDCPYKHSTEEIKECNMYKLGFCIYGPAVRFSFCQTGFHCGAGFQWGRVCVLGGPPLRACLCVLWPNCPIWTAPMQIQLCVS